MFLLSQLKKHQGGRSLTQKLSRGLQTNLLLQSQTWTGACDRRSALLLSYMHHTNDHRLHCHVGNTGQHCRLGVFQDADFAGDLEDSKSTSGGILCIFGSRTFVPINWMCKNLTSLSHSSTESEVISLEAGLRIDGLPALDLWDIVIEVLRTNKKTIFNPHISATRKLGQFLYPKTKTQHVTRKPPTQQAAGNRLRKVRSTNSNTKFIRRGNRDVDELSNVVHVVTNASSSRCEAQLNIFEDNEAVIKMIIKGRSLTMRHVSRTHRVALDWLFVDTKNQLADMLTKGDFTRDEWNHPLRLFNILTFSMFSCSHFLSIFKPSTMSKRVQERKTEDEFVVSTSRSAGLVSRNLSEKQIPSSLHTAWGIKS